MKSWSVSSPTAAPTSSASRSLAGRLGALRTGLGVALLCAAPAVRADIGGGASTDFDAEFACAADALEAGHRAEAEAILVEIVRHSGKPSWDARAGLMLSAADERRGDTAGAIRRLSSTSAESLGLEPYRHLALARLYAQAGRPGEAEAEARLAFTSEEPFGSRARAGLRLARLQEAGGRPREAIATIERALPQADRPDAEVLQTERLRLLLAVSDRGAAREAARLLLEEGALIERYPESVRPILRGEEAALSAGERARRARALLVENDSRRALALLSGVSPSAWPAEERSANLLALAEAQRRQKRTAASEKTLARIQDDGTEASWQARLLRVDWALARLRGGREQTAAPPEDPRYEPLRRQVADLTQAAAPVSVRNAARERLVRLYAEQGRFDEALAQADVYVKDTGGTGGVFEPLFKAAFVKWTEGDATAARSRFEILETLSPEIGRERRISYWKARSLEREGKREEASVLFARLAASDPADLYAQLSRRRVKAPAGARPAAVPDPAEATAAFRVPDELLRVRMFDEAAAEARRMPASRGRDLRLAQAEFALGHFFASVVAVKRAFPQMGTANEASVPDPWRRLYYPIEEGGVVATHAKEAGLDASLVRGLVRQESVFDARARSRAGAIGLMQLEPSTARSLSKSVLRTRYKQAFLYDPGKNASLGAAYLRQLVDQFGGSVIYALAAYNGGPPIMSRLIAENSGREEDEVFESHPFFETRDYVRRVLLYAEAYRELYP
jgi:soluble lytic murein transglycosylase-like protein